MCWVRKWNTNDVFCALLVALEWTAPMLIVFTLVTFDPTSIIMDGIAR